MTTRRLTVTDSLGEVAVMTQGQTGGVTIERCNPQVRPNIEKWVQRGLNELVGVPGDRHPRHTPPDHPELLERICAYIGRYDFTVKLEPGVSEASKKPALKYGMPMSVVRRLRVQMGQCRADSDGDCRWEKCPQTRDGEPKATGRGCPLDEKDPTDEGRAGG